MTEMVERVARAICLGSECDGSAHPCDKDSRGVCNPSACARWHLWTDAARASIEGMRNGTFEVYDAGICHPITAFREEQGQKHVTLEDAHVSGQHIDGLWQAMIDAALNPAA